MTNNQFQASPAQLRDRARNHIERGQLAAAQTVLESLIEQSPGEASAYIDLADVMFRRGAFRASTRPLLQVASRLPRDVPLILSLVQQLIIRGETAAARICLDLVAQAPNPPAEALFVQANLRFMIGQVSEGLAPAKRAIHAGIDTPDGWRLYAMLLQFNGQSEAAREILESCLTRWPNFGDAAPVLVDLRKQTREANYLELLEQRLRDLPKESGDRNLDFVRAELEYAVFKTLDDFGEHAEAWAALQRCNTIMHRLNPYAPYIEEAVTDALIDLPAADLKSTAESHSFEGPTPIFIVGMPRSGTTLLDRILSSHSEVASAGEIVDFWRQLHWLADVVPSGSHGLMKTIERSRDIDFQQLGSRYLKQTQWRAQGRRYYVDKLPGNIQMVAFIRRALPHAPILHMARDPLDTCFSNFKAMFGNVSPYSYELNALGHYYLQYVRLVKHWQQALPGAMLDVSYASLVREPRQTIQKVLAHCGLREEEACFQPENNPSPVATRSTPQVRESIHTKGLDQWRHYAAQLEPLRMTLNLSA